MLPGPLCHTEGDQSSLSSSCHMHRPPRGSCVSFVLLVCILECARTGPGHRACGGEAQLWGGHLKEDVGERAGGRETGTASSCSRFPVRKGWGSQDTAGLLGGGSLGKGTSEPGIQKGLRAISVGSFNSDCRVTDSGEHLARCHTEC